MALFRRLRLMHPGFWIAVLVTTILIVASMDMRQVVPEYRVTISPVAGQQGTVRIVFYDNTFDSYTAQRKIFVPSSGWTVIRGEDSTTLVEHDAVEPLRIVTNDEEVTVGLLRHAQGGIVLIENDAGYRYPIELRSPVETVASLIIGGADSSVPTVAFVPRFSAMYCLGVAAIVFGLLTLIALRMASGRFAEVTVAQLPRRWETGVFAFPLLLSTGAVLLAFFPGNVNYDGSLQWVQAATRGELSAPLGYPTTYFMRMFALISDSPQLLLWLQGVAAALGVALVLCELRYRGVPFWGCLVVVLFVALTPPYPAFFTDLGKDPLCATGTLFVTWLLLAALRQPKARRLPWHFLAALVGWGAFAGLMRFNAMPVIVAVLMLGLVMLYQRQRDRRLIVAGLTFIVLIFGIPAGLTSLAYEENHRHETIAAQEAGRDTMPLGVFANLYIYHLFGAAVASGMPLSSEDAELFYRIAPREAWAKYDCRMTDPTFIAVAGAILLQPMDYAQYLQKYQVAMAKAALRIVGNHPRLLLDRQICITDMLWHINMGDRPFQTTATLGYDSVDDRFLKLVGTSRSQVPGFASAFRRYQKWTERSDWFWLFWKPALPLLVANFVVGMYLVRTKDHGVFLCVLLPLLSMLLLMLVIPFPAYRYAYPSVLMMLIFGSLAFSRPLESHKHL